MSSDESEETSLRVGEPRQRIEALARIVARGWATTGEITAMIECLRAPQKLVQRRAAEALASLKGADETRRLLLHDELSSDDWRSRWGAAYALALTGPPPAETLPILLEALGVDDGDLRWAAVDLLLRMPDWDNALVDLCQLVAGGNPEQRKMAAYTLRALKRREPWVQSVLTSALSDAQAGVRMAAVSSLLHLATDRDEATDAACGLLRDADPGVQRATAALLGELGTPRKTVIDALREASNSDDESLRRAAARSLRKLGDDDR